MSNIYDVLIVGAGPAGSSAAYQLAKQGVRVLLLDKLDFPRDKACGDALSPRALRVLNEMHLLDNVWQIGRCVNTLKLIAPRGHTSTVSLPETDERTACGLIIPRLLLDDILRQQALACGAQFQSPVRVTDILCDGKSVEVRGEYHQQSILFRAHTAIIATGASIALLLRMGLLRKKPPMALAARAYFEGVAVANLLDHPQCHFNGFSSLGYGWVFPLSDSCVNIGAGFWPSKQTKRRIPNTAHGALDAFIQTSPLQRLLTGTHRTGPVKGFPVRSDFTSAPTFSERIMLVGEAAGLVHPLTGEGIAYALESGKLAAQHLYTMFSADDFSQKKFQAYDRLLRIHYQRLFSFCNSIHSLCLNPTIFPFLMNYGIQSLNLPKLQRLFLRVSDGIT